MVHRKISVFFSSLAVLIYCLMISPNVYAEKNVLLGYLPDASEFKGWKRSGSPKQVSGMELFAVINGGAELYLRHGCTHALFATYQTLSGQFMDVNVFEMKDRPSAENLFMEKTDPGGESVSIGDQALFEGYYLNFRKANLQVTISGSDPDKTSREEVMALAGAIAARMQHLKQ